MLTEVSTKKGSGVLCRSILAFHNHRTPFSYQISEANALDAAGSTEFAFACAFFVLCKTSVATPVRPAARAGGNFASAGSQPSLYAGFSADFQASDTAHLRQRY